jgi:predicted transcriptional regulator
MSEFVYLYRGGHAERSREKMQQTLQKWMNWLKLRVKCIFIDPP